MTFSIPETGYTGTSNGSLFININLAASSIIYEDYMMVLADLRRQFYFTPIINFIKILRIYTSDFNFIKFEILYITITEELVSRG